MPALNDFDSQLVHTVATIASSGTTSGTIALAGTSPVGVYLPAAFTGTTLTFTACSTAAGTFVAILDDAGGTLTRTVAQGRFLPLDPALFAGVAFLKIVSGSAEGAARDLIVVSRPV